MEKKTTNKSTRNDGYKPAVPGNFGYKPNKVDTKPQKPTTDTNVTKIKKD